MEGAEDLDADWSNGSYECIDCPPGNKHPRRSKRGVPPKRCPKHKAEKDDRDKAIALNKLREERGRKPIPVPGDEPAEPEPPAPEPDPVGVVEPLPAPAPHERTWLDDDDAQELLRQKREREVTTGVTYDPEVFGTVEEFLAADLMDPEVVEAGQEQELAGYGPTVDLDDPGPRIPEIGDDTAVKAWPAGEPEPEDGVCRVSICGSEAAHVDRLCGPHWQKVGLDERGILLGTRPGSDPFEQTLRRVLYKLSP